MGLFKLDEVRTKGEAALRAENARSQYLQKSMDGLLRENIEKQASLKNFDIFLSNAFKDAAVILGTKLSLEAYGYGVYVDWLEDPGLDRAKVTSDNARLLRERMDSCRCLLYAVTESSPVSKWMPWETGYFDGKKGRTAILPISSGWKSTYEGLEFLGLYPYVTEDRAQGTDQLKLWINESGNVYCAFDAWLSGKKPTKH